MLIMMYRFLVGELSNLLVGTPWKEQKICLMIFFRIDMQSLKQMSVNEKGSVFSFFFSRIILLNVLFFYCRWDLQRLRELKRNEYLKERRNKSHSQDEKKEELTSLFPNPACIKAFEITNNLPLSIFGENLYIKKDSAPLVYTIQYYLF